MAQNGPNTLSKRCSNMQDFKRCLAIFGNEELVDVYFAVSRLFLQCFRNDLTVLLLIWRYTVVSFVKVQLSF